MRGHTCCTQPPTHSPTLTLPGTETVMAKYGLHKLIPRPIQFIFIFQKRLAQWHGSVWSAWKGWKPSCLCGWLCGVGVFARGPLLSDSPLCRLLRCRVLSFLCCLFPPFQALQRVLCGWGPLQRSCVCAPCNPFFFLFFFLIYL
jgi:hypothetical protein